MALLRVVAACSVATIGTTGLFLGSGEGHIAGIHPQHVHPQQGADGPDILITSTGGVGTTRFIREMFTVRPPLRLNHKDDIDHLKHAPFWKLLSDSRTARKMRDVKKIVYLHGDPVHGILSLARRGYLSIQARKVRTDPIPKGGRLREASLQQLVDWDGDYLQLEEHFLSFFEQCQYPTAFVDVTRKTQEIEKLAAFLDVSEAELRSRLSPWSEPSQPKEEQTAASSNRTVPELREGQWLASHYNVSIDVVNGLERKYAGLKQTLSALGSLWIKPAGTGPGANCTTEAGGGGAPPGPERAATPS